MIHIGIGEVCALTCALLWGIAVVLLKKSGESLAPFALNLFKNALVMPLFVITLLVVEGAHWPAIPLAQLPLILLSGLLGIAAGDTLYFRALNSIGATRMAVAQTLYSPFVIALSMVMLHERLRPWQFGGVALVLAGITLVTWTRDDGGVAPGQLLRGAGYGVFAMFLMAAAIFIAKPLLEQYDLLWIVALRVAGGLAGMLLIVALRGMWPTLRAEYGRVRHWPQVIAGYKYTKASIAAVLNELAAVFIVILAVLFLKEKVSRRQVTGTLLAVGGVLMVVSS